MKVGLLQLHGTVPGLCFPKPPPVGSSAGCGFIPRVRRLCELEPALLPVLMLGLVLRLSGGGGSVGHGPGTGREGEEDSSHGSQESQRPRLGKGGVGLGKGGVGRGKLGPGRTLGDERHPPGAPVSSGQRADARQGDGVSETVAARGDGDRANVGMGNIIGIEERVREIEQAKAAKRSGSTARLAAARLTRRQLSSGPKRRGSAVSPKLAERLKMIDEAKLSGPTRSLRERHTRVNYEEGSDESKEQDDWSASQGGMIMSEEAAEAAATQGGGAGQQRVARAAKGQRAWGLGMRRRGHAEDKDANPLGQELSGSGEEGGDGELEESEAAREERRKRRLEEAAEEAAEDAEGEDGDVHKRYRAFRRKMLREFWGESPEPPPEPRREYTFEEDLALVLKSHLSRGFI